MTNPSHASGELAALAAGIAKLAALCQRLAAENDQLRRQQAQLVDEHRQLLSKNDLARNRVEQMIQRLRALEASP